MMDSQYGRPLIVGQGVNSSARALERIELRKSGDDQFSEHWLQVLISRHPNLLPINKIEPALTPVISVCMELPVPSGYVDNLYVTPAGDLIVGETKLYRNPEARREVIGQIFDYAKDLSNWTYEQLEAAISKSNAPDGESGCPNLGLYESVIAHAEGAEIDEAEFIDAVSRNLKRGRFLLLIVGDGIQSGVELISDFLQQHAGMHFTLGLVEMAVFKLGSVENEYLVQPRVLAKTINVERAIVRIEDGAVSVAAIKNPAPGTTASAPHTSISSEKFFEALNSVYPGIEPKLNAFLEKSAALGIVSEFGKGSLILRWRQDGSKAWNLGTITTEGKVWTELLGGQTDAIGRLDLSHEYLEKISKLVPGASVKQTPKPASRYVAKDNTYVTINDLIVQQDGWIAAIEAFMKSMSAAVDDSR